MTPDIIRYPESLFMQVIDIKIAIDCYTVSKSARVNTLGEYLPQSLRFWSY